MRNPFDDVLYQDEDLEALRAEAVSLLTRVNAMLARQLRQVARAAEEAHRSGKGLFVFAD